MEYRHESPTELVTCRLRKAQLEQIKLHARLRNQKLGTFLREAIDAYMASLTEPPSSAELQPKQLASALASLVRALQATVPELMAGAADADSDPIGPRDLSC